MEWKRAGKWVVAGLLCAPWCMGQAGDERVLGLLKEMKTDPSAQKILEEMGEKAYGVLRGIVEAGEGHANYAEAARVFPAVLEKTGRLTRVSVDFENVGLEKAMEALNAQSPLQKVGVNKGYPNLVNARVTVKRDKGSYNGVFWEICGKVNAALASDGRFIELAGSGKRPGCETWGNLLILDNVEVLRETDFGVKKPLTQKATASMQWWLDPCYKTICSEKFRDIEATDESGRKLAVVSMSTADATPMPGPVRVRQLVLEMPGDSKKIAKLAGNMWEYVGCDFETWTIEDGAKALGQEHVFGESKIAITEVTVNGNDVTVGISAVVPLFPDRPEIDGGARGMMPFTMMYGTINVDFEPVGTWNTMNAIGPAPVVEGGKQKMSFRSNMRKSSEGPAKDFKVRIVFPRRFEEIRVGFEFKDLELP